MSREAFEAWYDLQPDGRIQPWDVWQAAQADAFERAAKLCEDRYFVDTAASNAPTASDYVKIRHIAWAVGALNCATMIRALAKEAK